MKNSIIHAVVRSGWFLLAGLASATVALPAAAADHPGGAS